MITLTVNVHFRFNDPYLQSKYFAVRKEKVFQTQSLLRRQQDRDRHPSPHQGSSHSTINPNRSYRNAKKKKSRNSSNSSKHNRQNSLPLLVPPRPDFLNPNDMPGLRMALYDQMVDGVRKQEPSSSSVDWQEIRDIVQDCVFEEAQSGQIIQNEDRLTTTMTQTMRNLRSSIEFVVHATQVMWNRRMIAASCDWPRNDPVTMATLFEEYCCNRNSDCNGVLEEEGEEKKEEEWHVRLDTTCNSKKSIPECPRNDDNEWNEYVAQLEMQNGYWSLQRQEHPIFEDINVAVHSTLFDLEKRPCVCPADDFLPMCLCQVCHKFQSPTMFLNDKERDDVMTNATINKGVLDLEMKPSDNGTAQTALDLDSLTKDQEEAWTYSTWSAFESVFLQV
jgi:hypothetical protein